MIDMMVKVTKAEALRRQGMQIDHYAKMYGDKIRALVAAETEADELHDGIEYPVHIVHRYVPMGCGIEGILRRSGIIDKIGY